jgi:hypothetical protein
VPRDWAGKKYFCIVTPKFSSFNPLQPNTTRPNFVLTLIRTPNLPPTFATFIVPLNFNKLDLRDYLYNGYNIRVNAVRSYIQQQKLRQDKPGAMRPSPRKWFRPRSIKKMTVEMEQPFVWPEEPKDFEQFVPLPRVDEEHIFWLY